jgi:hypothetical protein
LEPAQEAYFPRRKNHNLAQLPFAAFSLPLLLVPQALPCKQKANQLL